ncbi:MAG: hypothetical protein GF330_03665 [Candidatus Eisenbacteria bacterium]|nr:hypothetical protein [Candidatus Eisenbacteria bacterium]
MATTLKQIAQFLSEADLKFQLREEADDILIGFTMPTYKNPQGRNQLLIVIKLEEGGEFLKLFTPKAYVYKEGPHALAVLKACMYVSWRTKMLQYEYDPSDGEIRAMIEFPLEDAELTQRQLMRVLMALPELLDRFDETIRTAIDHGKLVTEQAPDARLRELLERLSEMKPDELLEKLKEVEERTKEEEEKKKGESGPSQL